MRASVTSSHMRAFEPPRDLVFSISSFQVSSGKASLSRAKGKDCREF